MFSHASCSRRFSNYSGFLLAKIKVVHMYLGIHFEFIWHALLKLAWPCPLSAFLAFLLLHASNTEQGHLPKTPITFLIPTLSMAAFYKWVPVQSDWVVTYLFQGRRCRFLFSLYSMFPWCVNISTITDQLTEENHFSQVFWPAFTTCMFHYQNPFGKVSFFFVLFLCLIWKIIIWTPLQ